ncbi:MAG: hypothetical protein ACREJC_12235, partial [Tepidisphaeraceae bacterium]
QTSPGGIQSGLDYYQNDAGMVMVETTIGQTKFNAEGMSVGSRSRKAMQYGDSIDQIVDIFTQGNNGLYTNEWLIADTKTDEIACFELGTNKTKLYRSSKNEWFGGTEGFYWGCNNTKDLQVRLETIPATNDRPADMTFVPEPRDMMWVKLYREHKGNIDADFGKLAFTTPPLAAHSSCDAKVTTTDLTREMKSWALWGAPLGKSWQPTQDQREKYPDIKPLAGNPWTILTINPPASGKDEIAAVDLTKDDADDSDDSKDDDDKRQPEPAWHGTILASADADVWLASGFARFHEYAARSNQLANENKEDDKPLSEKQCDELAGKLFRARSDALIAARTGGAVPLSKIRSDVTDDNWARQATGRGVMLLCELRRKLGDEKFDAMMDAFGRENAGKPVTTASFIACAEMSAGTSLSDFFSPWIDGTALPTLKMVSVDSKKRDGSSSDKESWVVTGEVAFEGSPAPASVDVTLENEDDETTQTIAFEGGKASFKFDTEKKPMRVVANKYGFTPASNGWVFSTTSFMRDLDHTLIVYGTQDESSANREAAEEMQKAIRDSWKNYTVPIKSDIEVSDEDLRTHHLLLIGRPDCNSVTMKMREVLPVKFGWRSFIIRGETYANMNSAIISAGENPLNPALSVVCCAGLSAGATLHAAPMIAGWQGTPVKIVPAYGKSTDIVPEAPELAHSLSQ